MTYSPSTSTPRTLRDFYGTAMELLFDPGVLQVLGGEHVPGVDAGRAFVQVDPFTGEREPLDWRRPS